MPVLTQLAPLRRDSFRLRRITVAEYHRLIETGILSEDEPIELLEGQLVYKVPRHGSLTNGLPPLAREGLEVRAISVGEYHRMIEAGILAEDEPVELLEGFLVVKMPHNPAHDGTIQLAYRRLLQVLPGGWDLRIQSAVTLDTSEPEPDIAVVRGGAADYMTRHPGPADIGLLVEVAESSLAADRTDKLRIYAAARISVYWIINLIDRQIEVHSDPSSPPEAPGYTDRQVFRGDGTIPLVLGGATVATFSATQFLP